MNINQNDTYKEILRYFNTYTFYDNLLETKSYVSIDNIHDAILSVGLTLEQPIGYYIVKAKQFAINDFTASMRHYRIAMENANKLIGFTVDYDVIHEYGFTEIELDMVLELLAGVKSYKSAIPRRQYHKILEGIRAKVRATL